ncbi:cupredoxin family copper-binding protein [Paraburkholderia sp. IW21]|uniref:cupredoxin domain-containing protein n=1 Tax=Paraburkholderia sp. IW21 TaxID=3242488 RepID=UPI003521CFAB
MQTNAIRQTLCVLLANSALIVASASPLVAQAETPNTVVIKNFMFSPMALTIKAGSTVTWRNLDGEPHTVVNDAGMFRSAALDQNDTYQFKFDKPGVYKVFCGIHPNMRETITVQ